MPFDATSQSNLGPQFWRQQYSKRFPARGNEQTLKDIYDDIQREIDHERNAEEAIYKQMTGNRPDPALHQLMMVKIFAKREGLVGAFNEVLEKSSRSNIRLSLDALLQGFHIDTNWLLPRLWYALTEPLVYVVAAVVFLALGGGGLGIFIWQFSDHPNPVRPYAQKAYAQVQSLEATWGPFWWVKGAVFLLILYYIYRAIRSFFTYEKPSR
jgi:hypothetical protein